MYGANSGYAYAAYDGRGGDERGREPHRPYPQSGPQRERSRDGQRHGGGRGGGRGGFGGRGGRGNRRFYQRREKDEPCKVTTNYFPVHVVDPNNCEAWYEYRAEIFDARRKVERGPDGRVLSETIVFREMKDDDGNFIPGSRRELDGTKMSYTPLFRDVYMGLQSQIWDEEKIAIAFDGSNQVFASRRLFTVSDSTGSTEAVSSIYGPGNVATMQTNQSLLSKSYGVTIKRDCSKNDDSKDLARNACFMVILKEIGRVDYSVPGNLSPWADQVEKLTQVMDIISKNKMLNSPMSAYGKDMRNFYFPRIVQDKLRGRNLARKLSQFPNTAPFVALRQSSRACVSEQMYMCRDLSLSWLYLAQVPILDAKNKTIAGIEIESFHSRIPESERPTIQAALEKLKFHVIMKPNPTEEEKQKLRGKFQHLTDDVFERYCGNIVRHNQRMKNNDQDGRDAIIWSSDDRQSQFEFKDSQITVREYLKIRYHIDLRYPNMPIVLTKFGYYPVEFLFQAQGLVKGANSDAQSQSQLAFHDEFNGRKKIAQLEEASEIADRLNTLDIEKEFNLEISKTPKTLNATKLAEPRLVFGKNDSPQDVRNGSWQMIANGRALTFNKPADFASFAVVDFDDPSARNQPAQLVSGVLNRSKEHGLRNVQFENDYLRIAEEITVRADRRLELVAQVFTGINGAIEKARAFFLYDCEGYFRARNIMSETLVVHPQGGTTKCLVYPTDSCKQELGIVFPEDVMQVTHNVCVNGTDGDARMLIVVRNEGGEEYPVDPFNFRWYSSDSPSAEGVPHWEARSQSTGVWQRVYFQGHAWKMLHDNGSVVKMKDVVVNKCVQCATTWQIDCPSVIFAVLPDKSKDLYQLVKLSTNFCRGIQSQCLVWDTYKRQKNKDQYFSSIALKLNTKLANSVNKAQAWQIGDYQGGNGIPWISEAPTLIMGIAMSRGSGRESKTVVAATVVLTDHLSLCMQNAYVLRLQTKRDGVESHVMQSITKALAVHFYEHTGTFPERVLVFRDGTSEGQIPEITSEIDSIREALSSVQEKVHKNVARSPGLEQSRITFVLCLNQHNVQIVPSREENGAEANVMSGTCVSEGIMPASGSSDFLLTAQGGLKGTSKPVFYRVILNENHSLTRHVMQSVVFGLSFNYGTATKATRRLSVAQYSKRLAEQFLAYLPYIDEDGRRTRTEGMPVLTIVEDEETHVKSVCRKHREVVMSELLPGFGPYSDESRDFDKSRGWHVPLRPHLAS